MLPGGNAQALALAGGVAGQTLVPAQHPAGAVHKIAGSQGYAAVLLQEADIVSVGNEADVLTVGLVGVDKPCLTGALTDGGLVVFPHGQQQMGQLVWVSW